MKKLKPYLNLLMILIAASLSSSCVDKNPQDNLILVDISSSNKPKIPIYLKKVSDVYGQSFAGDKFTIYYFSSIKLLAYSGGKLNKDRDFEAVIKNGYEKSLKIHAREGTSFEVCKKLIESKEWDKVFLFTDGYFEKSQISKINNKTNIFIEGLDILNNERVLNMFEKPELVNIRFQGD